MKRKLIGLVIVILLYLSAFGQYQDLSQFSRTVNKEYALKHISVLASDKFEGRGTGTRGAWLAANYIKSQFQKNGLSGPFNKSYFQFVDLIYDKLSQSLSIGNEPLQPWKDFDFEGVVPDGYILNTDNIVFVNPNLSNEKLEKYDQNVLKGKIVMFVRPLSLEERIRILTKLQLAGIIVVSKGFEIIDGQILKDIKAYKKMYPKADTATSNSQTTLPYIRIGTRAADLIFASSNSSALDIKERMKKGLQPDLMELKVAVKGKFSTRQIPVKADNVLGYLEGADPVLKSEVLVISSHYDHIGGKQSKEGVDRINNGADDDGSGTTGVLLLAEAFAKAKKAGKGPKRSILFVTFVGEEKGLLGSTYYTDHPVFPLENTIANLNMDMIGRGEEKRNGDNNYVYTIGAGLISSELDSINKKVNADHVGLKLEVGVDGNPRSYYTASDHYNFVKHGIPVIFYFNGVHEDYHKPSDEIDKIDFDALVKRVRLVYYTAWELANRPNRLRIDRE